MLMTTAAPSRRALQASSMLALGGKRAVVISTSRWVDEKSVP